LNQYRLLTVYSTHLNHCISLLCQLQSVSSFSRELWLTGSVGSVIGNPFHVLKTLSQSNQGKAVPLMTLVLTVHHAEQGMAGFYRDVTANIMGACVLNNATKMVCYNVLKGHVCNAAGWARKNVRTSFRSALLAGFFMTCTVCPFDCIRTGLMSQLIAFVPV
jgi:hypothetical protein